MKVLSLFDGISCGMVALERAGIKVDTYYASEIDKSAIAISQKNYPNIVRLGDVTKWREWNIDWSQIDLLIGGSPCQGFSFAGKQLNFDDPRSKLFFEFVDILNHIKSKNPNVKFLLENVKMKKEYVQTITDYLGVQPIEINSELVSAQNRKRLYWTNITNITIPEDKGIEIKDIICEVEQEELIGKFKNCIRKNVVSQYEEIINSSKKIHQLKCSSGWQDNKVGITKTPTLRAGNSFCLIKTPENKIRLITITEAERLQNLPDGYTEGVAENNRFSAIGNGWTVDVIAYIFSFIPTERGVVEMIEKRIGEELEMSDKIETFEAIVEAVEKQIPYKPTQWSNGAWKCKCGKLHVCHDWEYCPNCGQRVDLR